MEPPEAFGWGYGTVCFKDCAQPPGGIFMASTVGGTTRIWNTRVCDAAGEITGGLGADDPPYDIKHDLWVFESCTTETPALGWRLKARLGLEQQSEEKS